MAVVADLLLQRTAMLLAIIVPIQPKEYPNMPSTRGEKDACDLLDADHKAVKKMFKEYDELTESKARSASQRKQELAHQICQELTVHAQVEEEIFYPALRGALKDTDLLDEAEVEHQTAKDLIAQIQAGGEEEKIDAKVKVLGEYITHHVKEEEQPGGLFAQAKKGDEDLEAMGERMKARKEELMAEMGAKKPN